MLIRSPFSCQEKAVPRRQNFGFIEEIAITH
jgi:hypothetical protein